MAISIDNFSSPPSSKSHATQIFLRILAIGTTLSAACLMFTNKQATVVYGIPVDARYTYSPAFKFFAFANIVAFALSLLSLILVFLMGRKAASSTHYFCLFLHDLIITTLLMAALAASWAIAYVGKFGNSHTGWIQICDHFGKFCNRGIASTLLGFLGVIIYLILTIVSANQSRQIRA
ncbi:CASP-like protein 1F2 [Salvia miltiorrhiza]|uniref:CASP-like protein 1F2 n=1 Tax=Salvia miltiorrhiza TaxID=226208 RepID=UPI0025ABEDBE|nr:CASP-like protein 1F2 [Salvia miltiorrhiza]